MESFDWSTWLGPILTAVSSVVVALASFLVSFLRARSKDKECEVLRQEIQEMRLEGYFIVCPKCGAKVNLSDLKFFAPGGYIDENHDHKPD